MSHARIRLLKTDLLREKPIFDADEQAAFARKHLNTGFYTACILETTEQGEAAAEEMFDLTNNPHRQQEREARYGIGRSVSSGDIITVDGVDFLCCSIGWRTL